MNKIVREHYLASKLPEELRGGIDPTHEVTVTVIEEGQPEQAMNLDDLLDATKGYRRFSGAEILADIRKQRDEWE